MSIPDPYATAQTLLEAFAAAWDGAKLPTGQWVAEGGEVAADGAQVAVIVGDISPGLPGRAMTGSRPPRAFPVSARFTIEMWRDRRAGLTRQGGRESVLPSAAQNASAGKASGADMTAMLAALLKIRENGSVVSHSTKIAINSVSPLGPRGDLVGVSGSVTILLGHD